MRRKDKIIEDSETIQKILRGNVLMRLALADDAGMPYIVPVNYGYQENKIYIHSAPEGRKIEILKKNSIVCFETEQDVKIIPDKTPCKWTTQYQSLIGYGNVKIIEDIETKRYGLDIIMAQNNADRPYNYDDKLLEKLIILEISIENLSGKQSGY